MILQQLLPNSTATPVATLVIDGLAVCCFDNRAPANLHWEMAFLRDQHHGFEISVAEKTLDGTVVGVQPTYYVPDLVSLNLIVDGGSIDHYLQYPKGYYHPSTPFSRDIDHDHNDFRWVIDFTGTEVGHGNFDGLKQKSAYPNRVDVTLLEMPNSLLYTQTLTASPAITSSRAETNPCEAYVFGHTNALVGGFVFADRPGRIKIKGRDRSGTVLIIKDLEYKANQFYEIEFKNMDKLKSEALSKNTGVRAASSGTGKLKEYEKGDFERFYEIIGVTGTEKSLWGRKSWEHGRLGDCHVVMVDSTIQTLEPLLS